jgi:predicted trehalose synthase
MTEYRVVANDNDSEDRLVRAVHADDLCAAIWQMQEELAQWPSFPADECEADQAERWLERLNEILHETGAAAAMERYR